MGNRGEMKRKESDREGDDKIPMDRDRRRGRDGREKNEEPSQNIGV